MNDRLNQGSKKGDIKGPFQTKLGAKFDPYAVIDYGADMKGLEAQEPKIVEHRTQSPLRFSGIATAVKRALNF